MFKYSVATEFKQGEMIAVQFAYLIRGVNKLEMHMHDFLELAYIYEGKGTHIINTKKVYMQKGDLFFFNKNTAHCFEATSSDFQWISCLFLPEALHLSKIISAQDILNITPFANYNKLRPLVSQDIILNDPQNEFEKIFLDMLNEYTKQQPGYQNILQNMLNTLFIKIFRTMYFQTTPSTEFNDFSKEIRTELLLHSTEEDVDQIILKIAQKNLTNPRYLPYIFKKQTKKTLTSFLQEQKIKKACTLLRETNKPVVIIMNEVGYFDSKFFYKLFSKFCGMTPAQYRAAYKDNSK